MPKAPQADKAADEAPIVSSVGGDPVGNPDEPYWQSTVAGMPTGKGTRIGGLWRRVTPHHALKETDKQFKTRLKREQAIWQRNRDRLQIRIGDWCKWCAIAMFVISAYFHFSSTIPKTKSLASSGMSMAGVIYAGGVLMQFEANAGSWMEVIVVGGAVVLTAIVLYKRRNKPFSLRKPKPKQAKPKGGK